MLSYALLNGSFDKFIWQWVSWGVVGTEAELFIEDTAGHETEQFGFHTPDRLSY